MKIITGVDVFAEVDLDHPVAAVRRAGGGKYRVLVGSEQLERDETTGLLKYHEFDSIELALEYADGIAKLVDDDPSLASPQAVHANALLAIVTAESKEKDDRIAQLEAELAKATTTDGE